MATSAKMSYNFYQNGKYGTLPQNPSKDMEVTQDMHLKMSKKIAQLTKVIYALNTKNDEHEATVAALKDQHEEQIQQLLSETKAKLDIYKSKVCNETEYRHRIESLEACVSQYEQKRQEAFSQFEAFKQQAELRETKLKTEHSEKMLTLSQEVLVMKKEFEDQLQKFSDLKFEAENNQEQCMEDLRKKHEEEILKLKEAIHGKSNDFDSERLKLEEIHKLDIDKLEEQFDALKAEKTKMMEDYEGKLNKAQAFYENELAVLKRTHSTSFETEMDALRKEQEKLKKDFTFQESEYKQRIDSLIAQVSLSEEEIGSYKQQLEALQASVAGKDSGMSDLDKQLQIARNEAAQATTQLREQEAELVASKHMCSQQAQDLLTKSSLIGELEATRLQHESKIGELQSELSSLRDRLTWLEKERQELASQQTSLTESSSVKLHALEQALEDLSVEKQTMKERYERDMKSIQERFEERERTLVSDYSNQIEQLTTKHREELRVEKEQSLKTLNDTTAALEKKLTDESERLTGEKLAVTAEFEKVKADLFSKLQAAENEVERLQSAVKDSESGLGSASVHINNLKEASARLKQELDNSRGELKLAKTNAAKLQAELDKSKLSYEAKLTATEHELQSRLQQLTTDLETKWTETLRKETTQLRQDLVRQKEDEMKAALQQLAKLKDDELRSVREERERQVTQLLSQIAELKSKVEQSESSASAGMDRLRQEAEAAKRRLEEEVKRVEGDYSVKLAALELEHRAQLEQFENQKARELEELERGLKSAHVEEMQGQITAHKAALDSALQEAQQAKVIQLGDLKAKHKQDLDTLETRLSLSHAAELQQQAEAHQSQLQAARIELERSIEITKQKERDHKGKTEELQSEISQRERHIKNLDAESHKLRRQLEYLSRELENKGTEISKVKADAETALRQQEDSLRAKQEANLGNLAADHLRETEEMLVEFNRAQELLKDKISELQILLEEAEERYRCRDSRPEDLELIEQLREAVMEREGRMKALIDEKRYYQMELVNRETNFNKVFNSAPNVGVLNPLSKPKKKGATGKFISSPNLNAWSSANRLDPLPNSPLHDEKLNPTKPLPLPNFAKKFVK